MEINEGNFNVVGKHCLVRRDEPESESGGIIIPDNVKTYGWNATVLQVGNRVNSGLQTGDRILFLKEYTVLPFKDRSLAVTDGKKILARIVEGDTYEEIYPLHSFILISPSFDIYEKGGIRLSDKSVEHADNGTIIRVGCDCKVAKERLTAYYKTALAVKCVENDDLYHLIDESELLCIGE